MSARTAGRRARLDLRLHLSNDTPCPAALPRAKGDDGGAAQAVGAHRCAGRPRGAARDEWRVKYLAEQGLADAPPPAAARRAAPREPSPSTARAMERGVHGASLCGAQIWD